MKMDKKWALEIVEEVRADLKNDGVSDSSTRLALVFLADELARLHRFWNKQIAIDDKKYEDHLRDCRVGGTKP